MEQFVVDLLKFPGFAGDGETDAVINLVSHPIKLEIAMDEQDVGIARLAMGFDVLVTVGHEDGKTQNKRHDQAVLIDLVVLVAGDVEDLFGDDVALLVEAMDELGMGGEVGDGGAGDPFGQSGQNDFALLFDEGTGLSDDVVDVAEALIELFDPLDVEGFGFASYAVSHVIVPVILDVS